MRFLKPNKEEAKIEITPLIDVMFILIIFVLITAQYRAVAGIKVNLPAAKAAQGVEKGNYIVVTLTRDGQLEVNGARTRADGLEERLNEVKKGMENPFVLIQADEGTATGQLVSAMDAASKSGLSKISIETRKIQ